MTLRNSRGFSLVEVLIALIIMSVGMLGIAGLYVQSLQAGRTSMLRHHAVTLAGDIADRIRANPMAGAAYTAAAGQDNNCVAQGANCDASQMAAHDIFLWQAQKPSVLCPAAIKALDDQGLGFPFTVDIRSDISGVHGFQGYAPSVEVGAKKTPFI